MQEELKLLLELSAVDKKAHELELTKKDLPVRIQNLKGEVIREKTQLEKINSDLAETKAKIEENQEIALREQIALNDSNKKLDNISTNREYDAIHSEIATHKKNIDMAQANTIHFQQVHENILKDQENAQASFAKISEDNEPLLNTLSDELSGIQDRINEQKAHGEEPRKNLSKKILSVYDRVVQRRGNPNVVSAINRDQKACEVCNRTQTPQRIIEISKRNNLLTCESCGSILVWKD